MDRGLEDIMGLGWMGGAVEFGDQYDPTEYNMGAAASAHINTVLDNSGTRKNKIAQTHLSLTATTWTTTSNFS